MVFFPMHLYELKNLITRSITRSSLKAWEGVVGAVEAAQNSKQQVVESEHLMKALLEQKDGLARRIFTKAGLDNTSVLQATDDFIAQQPKVHILMFYTTICI